MPSQQRGSERIDSHLFDEAIILARRVESSRGSQKRVEDKYQRALRAEFRKSFLDNPTKFRQILSDQEKLVFFCIPYLNLGDLQSAPVDLRKKSEKTQSTPPESQMLRLLAFVALCYSLMLAACTDEVPPQIPTPTTTEVPPAAPTAEKLTELVGELPIPTQTVPVFPEPSPTSTLAPELVATPKVAFATQTPAPEPTSEAETTPAPQETGVGGKFSQSEQSLLTELINQYATEWGIASSENVTVDKDENGIVYLLISNLENITNRIIYLASLDPITVAETDLAAARTAATANDTNPEAIVYLGLDLLTGQPGAFGANGELIATFDPSSSMWRLPTPPTPEPTPVPTETPAPEKRVYVENGVYTALTEKGEVVTAPSVPGTKQSIETINGIDRVVYLAEAGNPYGIETGTMVGYLYPDTYIVTKEVEDAQIKGGLVLHSKLIEYELKQLGSPQKVAVFPLPFDPTYAIKTDNPMIFVQETINTIANIRSLFFSVPKGTRVVNNLPPLSDSEPNARSVAQNWGTAINLAYPNTIKGLYFLNLTYDGTKNSTEKIAAGLGFNLIVINTDELSKYITEFYQTRRSILPAHGVNLELYANSLLPEGRDNLLNLTQDNIFKIGGLLAMVLSEKSPQN